MRLEKENIIPTYEETTGKISSLNITFLNGDWVYKQFKRDERSKIIEFSELRWSKVSNLYSHSSSRLYKGFETRKEKICKAETGQVIAGRKLITETQTQKVISERIYKYKKGDVSEIIEKDYEEGGDVSVTRQVIFLEDKFAFSVLTEKGKTPQITGERLVTRI